MAKFSWMKRPTPSESDETEHVAPPQEDGQIEGEVAEHRSFIPKKLHLVVIAALALGIGAATYFTSVRKQNQAEESAKAQATKSTDPTDLEKRGDLAKQEIGQAKLSQEQAQEKKDKRAASQPVGSTRPAGMDVYPTNAQPTPIQNAGLSNGKPGDQPASGGKAALPPPPPISSAYNPAPLTQTATVQGGDDGVRQRAGSIIALTGGGSVQTRAAAANNVQPVSASNARSALDAAQQELTATLAKNAAEQEQIMPFTGGQQQTRSYPLAMTPDQIREQLMTLRSQLQGGGGAVSLASAMAPPAAAMPPMSIPQTAQAIAPQVSAAGRPEAGVAPSISSVKYDGKLVLRQGSLIPAVSQSAINSDLAGDITALVTENVYDSVEGSTLLIPKGSRLVAKYGEDIRIGQERVMISFSRLLLPNGSYVMLTGGMNGVDTQGRSGMDADVNNHFFKMFGAGLVGAVVTWGVENSSRPNVTINNPGTSTDLTGPTAKVLEDITNRIMDRYKNIAPTLTIEPGQRLKLFVKQDMLLPSYTD
ncbi:TrbI/VirB10 family protein [Crenobacter sp. SG2305]|uniref:TrbI/VirB10 family protein n=1 Tax=Crenobacter oryzisoli TaxID=3056844 RepID=UPI0025AAF189|nr:TrbI/VirB10 family protein [Crenobacter sp. SG2305]MDN0082481.1 TrbI/VirB10 family protein [Crenobacter sp. SG2305]